MKVQLNFSGLGFELGQMHRGLRLSPEKAKTYFSILENVGLEIVDCGQVSDEKKFQTKIFNESDIKKMNWSFFEEAYAKTEKLLIEKAPLLNWGGDHSIAISTVGAFTHQHPEGFVIWIDAHADLNLPSYSLTGNLHGMPLSILLNLNQIASYNYKWIKSYLRPEKLIYIGLRDLDPFEEETIAKLGITAFTRRRLRKWGMDQVMSEIAHKIGHHPVHISFDIDSVDPRLAPATGVPVHDGLSQDDLDKLGERLSQMNLRSMDVVEINPQIGTTLQVDQTYITAIHFIKKLFAIPGGFDESMGQRIKAEHTSQMERFV